MSVETRKMHRYLFYLHRHTSSLLGSSDFNHRRTVSIGSALGGHAASQASVFQTETGGRPSLVVVSASPSTNS